MGPSPRVDVQSQDMAKVLPNAANFAANATCFRLAMCLRCRDPVWV